ncbi:hypothetical protein [Mycobacterium sp.]|uniref:hypothetical protein n=1 Tax=Mycobacterium sp. TaxID=1785 RepID=UPI0025DC4879|nr:hypothetical protein [Mycobacterium sp.]
MNVIAFEAASAGRDWAAFEWMCFVYVRVDDDASAARQRALSFIGDGQAGSFHVDSMRC